MSSGDGGGGVGANASSLADVVSFWHEYPRVFGASNRLLVEPAYFYGVGYTSIPYVIVAGVLAALGVVLLVVPFRAWARCCSCSCSGSGSGGRRAHSRATADSERVEDGDSAYSYRDAGNGIGSAGTGGGLEPSAPPMPSAPALRSDAHLSSWSKLDDAAYRQTDHGNGAYDATAPSAPVADDALHQQWRREQHRQSDDADARSSHTDARTSGSRRGDAGRKSRRCLPFFPPPWYSAYLLVTYSLFIALGAGITTAFIGNIVAHTSLTDTFDIVESGASEARADGERLLSTYSRVADLLEELSSLPVASALGIDLSAIDVDDIRAEARSIYNQVLDVAGAVDDGLGTARYAESWRFGGLLACGIVLWLLMVCGGMAVYVSCRFAASVTRRRASASLPPSSVSSASKAYRYDAGGVNAKRRRGNGGCCCCGPVSAARWLLLGTLTLMTLAWLALAFSVAYGVLNGDLCVAASAREAQLRAGINLDGESDPSAPENSLERLIYCPAKEDLDSVLALQNRTVSGALDELNDAISSLGLTATTITLDNFDEIFAQLLDLGGIGSTPLGDVIRRGNETLTLIRGAQDILSSWAACTPVLNTLSSALAEQCDNGIHAATVSYVGFLISSIFATLFAFWIVSGSKAQNYAAGL